MGCSFQNWEIDGTDGQGSSASLLELNFLPCLAVLCIDVKNMKCFPDNFSLSEVEKYEISVGTTAVKCYPSSRSFSLREDDLSLLDRVVTLFQRSYDLTFFCVEGNFNRILPDLDQGGLNRLKCLQVTSCVYIYSLIMDTPSPHIIFANLEVLRLHRLEKMMLLGRAVLPVGSLQKLRYLEIRTCKFLVRVALTSNWVDRLHNLEEVVISNCEMLRWVFEIQENTAEQGSLPLLFNIRRLSLSFLPQLVSLLKGPSEKVSFGNLATVKIYDCKRLGYIFSRNVSHKLLHLETLEIRSCWDLKAIFEEPQSRIHSLEFPNLKVVEIDGCDQLRSLFTVSIARGLSNLKELAISRNRKLVELISHEENFLEGNDNEECIALPQLARMQLKHSPSLKRFCPIGNSMVLPLLKELILEASPEWKNFASTYSDFGLKSAPELAKLQIDGQLLDGLK